MANHTRVFPGFLFAAALILLKLSSGLFSGLTSLSTSVVAPNTGFLDHKSAVALAPAGAAIVPRKTEVSFGYTDALRFSRSQNITRIRRADPDGALW